MKTQRWLIVEVWHVMMVHQASQSDCWRTPDADVPSVNHSRPEPPHDTLRDISGKTESVTHIPIGSKRTNLIIKLKCILPYPLLVIFIEFRLKYLLTDRTCDMLGLIAGWNNNKPCVKLSVTLGTLGRCNGLDI